MQYTNAVYSIQMQYTNAVYKYKCSIQTQMQYTNAAFVCSIQMQHTNRHTVYKQYNQICYKDIVQYLFFYTALVDH